MRLKRPQKVRWEDQFMRKCSYLFFLVAIVYSTLGLLPAAAQEVKSSVTGTVKDSANAY
jgi:hypothetical protein